MKKKIFPITQGMQHIKKLSSTQRFRKEVAQIVIGRTGKDKLNTIIIDKVFYDFGNIRIILNLI